MPTDIRVLFVLTSHAKMGNTGDPTGFWAEEFATPYYTLRDAGVEVDVVSIAGGAAPIDPSSLKPQGENEASVDRFLKDDALRALINATPALTEAKLLSDYDAIFLPGGHGTMWDLPQSEALATAIATIYDAGGVVAAVCHGPAGLVNVTLADGSLLVSGRTVTAFTNSEEAAVGLADTVPFLLETRLAELGARFVGKDDWVPHVVTDGRLVTGQNPASSTATAQAVLDLVGSTFDRPAGKLVTQP